LRDNLAAISALQDYFFKKLADVRKEDSDDIDDIAIVPLLDAWASCLDWARRAKLTETTRELIAANATGVRNQLDAYGQLQGSAARSALRRMSGALHVFEDAFVEVEGRATEVDNVRNLRRKTDRAGDAAELAWGVMAFVSARFKTVDAAVTEGKNAARDANASVLRAEKAATKSATGALEQSFATTAENNNTIAWFFRIGTLVILGVIIVLASAYVFEHKPSDEGEVDWYAITYRIAILSAFGVLAGYLGRQAGNYTRLATWAHSIQIQLKAFPGFVNEIKDEESRQTMFALFGKRVLESPPDGKSSGDDGPTNLIQPIFEQAAKLRSPQG